MVQHGANDGTKVELREPDGWRETTYAYGMMLPNYPVPSLLGQVFYEPNRIGIDDPDDPDWSDWVWYKD